MKSILLVLHLTLCLSVAFHLQAQQFKMVRANGVGFYLGEGEMHTAQVTSALPLGGNDTAFGFYTVVDTIPGLPGNCVLSANTPGWLGARMVVDSSINNYFFNSQGDTIFFRPGETNGYRYRFYTYPDGRYIEAVQTNDQFVDIIGVFERIKTFTLEEKDANGQPAPGLWEGRTFSFSDRYGFSSIFNLQNFPNDTATYTLIGFAPPLLGQPALNAFSIFALQQGYEMHYREQWYDAATQQSTTSLEKRIYLTIEADQTGDTLWQTAERTRWITTDGPSADTSYLVDTIVDTIALSGYAFLNGSHRQLFAFAPGRYGYSRHFVSDTTGAIFRKAIYRPYTLDAPNVCLIPEQDTVLKEVYGDGLGITEWLDSTDMGTHHRLLVYAQKGVQQWGTPINFDQLLTAQPPAVANISIFPNPGREGFTIDGMNGPVLVTIRSVTGQIASRQSLLPGQRFVTTSLTKGWYWVEVASDEGVWQLPWIKY